MTADPLSADPTAANRPYREVTDARGRVYRIGETDRDILGHSRKLMVYLPWIAMMAISVFEYAYVSAEDTLSHAHGWTQSNTFWILSVWVFFQAGIAFPAGWLREKGILTARRAMYIGSGPIRKVRLLDTDVDDLHAEFGRLCIQSLADIVHHALALG